MKPVKVIYKTSYEHDYSHAAGRKIVFQENI
jgi:hypothetical protein